MENLENISLLVGEVAKLFPYRSVCLSDQSCLKNSVEEDTKMPINENWMTRTVSRTNAVPE